MIQVPQGYVLIKQEEYDELVERNVHLEDLVLKLVERIDELEARLNKNSTNSSIPPSKDEITKPYRNKGGSTARRKPGGQKGHKGTTRLLVSDPKRTISCHPEQCDHCNSDLSGIKAEVVERRQEIDIPPIKPVVIEYQRKRITCTCGHMNTGEFPDHITAPVQFGKAISSFLIYLNVAQLIPYARLAQLCSDLFDFPVSKRTIENILQRGYEKAKPLHKMIMKIVKGGLWVGTDETGKRVIGKRWWEWVWQNDRATYYAVDQSRGYKVVEQHFGTDFSGVLVHDCWSAHNNTPAHMGHQLCHAHLIRDLQGLIDNNRSSWAWKLQQFLLASEKAHGVIWQVNFDANLRARIIKYHHEKFEGFLLTAQKVKDVRRFQKRMGKHRDKILLFLDHSQVPFHNNSSERAIRMTKVKQKISGCFRSINGAMRHSVLLSVIETAKKQEMNLLKAIQNLLNNELTFKQT